MTEVTATVTSALEASRQRLDLASPREIAGLAHLELVARHIVEGFLIGLHDSPKRGFSAEFAEDRPYNRGDDLRYLDWKAYARTDRLYIKQFEEETNLRAYLLVDVSRSMAWVSDPERFPTKLEYARLLAASLSLLLVQQSDATGLLAFDEELRAHVAPRTTRRHWRRLVTRTHAPRRRREDRRGDGAQGNGGPAPAAGSGDPDLRPPRRSGNDPDVAPLPEASGPRSHPLPHHGSGGTRTSRRGGGDLLRSRDRGGTGGQLRRARADSIERRCRRPSTTGARRPCAGAPTTRCSPRTRRSVWRCGSSCASDRGSGDR